MSDLDYLRLALKQAHLAQAADEVPIGAVVVSQTGQVVGLGRNTREHGFDPTGHAEVHALREAAQVQKDFRLESTTLYVTLEPCPMCLSAAMLARVRRLVFGAWDKKGGALSLGYKIHDDARLNHRFEVQFEAGLPECGELLMQFFKNKRGRE